MIIPTKPFTAAINHALLAVPAKSPLPVLTGIRLESTGGVLHVSGYDGTTLATQAMPANGDLPATLVSGVLLKEVASKASGDQMVIELDENQLRITAGRAKAQLQTMPVEEYPALPTTLGEVFRIDGGAWTSIARSVAYAASKEDTLPVLTAVNFNAGDGRLTAQSTDRYRLAENTVNIDGDYEGQFMVAAKTVLDISRHLNPAETWTVRVNDSLISVNDGTSQIARALIDGDYPRMTSLFPEATPNTVTVDREELTAAIGRATVLLDLGAPVELTVEPDTITVTAGGGGKGASTEKIDTGHTTGEPDTLKFNPGFITDALNGLSSSQATLGWTDRFKPVTVTGDDVDHRQLVMPNRG